jgi:hypothetical protein
MTIFGEEYDGLMVVGFVGMLQYHVHIFGEEHYG